METQTARRGVDDIAGDLRCRRQILFFVWVTLNEQKWVTFAERRGSLRTCGFSLTTEPNLLRSIAKETRRSLSWSTSESSSRRAQPIPSAFLKSQRKCSQSLARKSALRDFVPDGPIGATGSSFAKRLGRWLKRISTRRWGNIELVPVEDKHNGVWKYQIGENIKKRLTLDTLFEEPEAA
jgi:hypothetical protein